MSSIFLRSCTVPTLVATLAGEKIVNIAAGSMHSAAVTDDGVLYTWGKGSYGRLGHGKQNIVQFLISLQVHVHVQCMRRYGG